MPTKSIKACNENTGTEARNNIHNSVDRKSTGSFRDWRKSVIVPLWTNKANRRECQVQPGISLLGHTGFIFSKIPQQRFMTRCKPAVQPIVIRFQLKGSSCTDALSVVNNCGKEGQSYDTELSIRFIHQEIAPSKAGRNIRLANVRKLRHQRTALIYYQRIIPKMSQRGKTNIRID